MMMVMTMMEVKLHLKINPKQAGPVCQILRGRGLGAGFATRFKELGSPSRPSEEQNSSMRFKFSLPATLVLIFSLAASNAAGARAS